MKLNTKSNQNESSSSLQKISNTSLLTHYTCTLCPSLPEILSFNEASGLIKLKCKKHGQVIVDIHEYLEKMANILSSSKITNHNVCLKHKKGAYFQYCLTCQENLCEKCLSGANHDNHIKYSIESCKPNNFEIEMLNNRMNLIIQKKKEMIQILKNMDDKIKFYKILLTSFEKNKPNFFLNINIKHLLYGENINFEEISKNINNNNKKDDNIKEKTFINDNLIENFVAFFKNKKQLSLVDQAIEDEFMDDIIQGIENGNILNILKAKNLIHGKSIKVSLNNIKILNLRGNKITKIDYLGKIKFPSLEILSLNDNELTDIINLKNINCPILKELYLAKNKINCIEALEFVNMKKLEILWLADNKIESVDILAKVKFPQLAKLGLNKNNIKDINVLKKVKFPQLLELYINNNDFQEEDFQDLIDTISEKISEFYY